MERPSIVALVLLNPLWQPTNARATWIAHFSAWWWSWFELFAFSPCFHIVSCELFQVFMGFKAFFLHSLFFYFSASILPIPIEKAFYGGLRVCTYLLHVNHNRAGAHAAQPIGSFCHSSGIHFC